MRRPHLVFRLSHSSVRPSLAGKTALMAKRAPFVVPLHFSTSRAPRPAPRFSDPSVHKPRPIPSVNKQSAQNSVSPIVSRSFEASRGPRCSTASTTKETIFRSGIPVFVGYPSHVLTPAATPRIGVSRIPRLKYAGSPSLSSSSEIGSIISFAHPSGPDASTSAPLRQLRNSMKAYPRVRSSPQQPKAKQMAPATDSMGVMDVLIGELKTRLGMAKTSTVARPLDTPSTTNGAFAIKRPGCVRAGKENIDTPGELQQAFARRRSAVGATSRSDVKSNLLHHGVGDYGVWHAEGQEASHPSRPRGVAAVSRPAHHHGAEPFRAQQKVGGVGSAGTGAGV
ncbi:hypothetical protein DFH09DRAFT_1402183 [Mycena vulgaris]|nr:hypothetical protein DFH09DRAFT_1402183 [Mycena vulgaris]